MSSHPEWLLGSSLIPKLHGYHLLGALTNSSLHPLCFQNFIRATSSWLLLPQILMGRSLLLSFSVTPTSLKGGRRSGCGLGEPALSS